MSTAIVWLSVAATLAAISWFGAFRLQTALSGSTLRLRIARTVGSGLLAGAGGWSAHSLAFLAAPHMRLATNNPLFAGAAAMMAITLTTAAFAVAEWRRENWLSGGVLAGSGLAASLMASLGALHGDPGAAEASRQSAWLLATGFVAGGAFAGWQAGRWRRTALLPSAIVGVTLALGARACVDGLRPAAFDGAGDPLGHIELAAVAVLIVSLVWLGLGAVAVVFRLSRVAALAAYQRAIDALPSAMAFFDAAGDVAGFNSAYARLFAPLGVAVQLGMPRSSILGAAEEAGWFEAVGARDRARAFGGEAARIDLELQLHDQRVLTVQTFAMEDGGRAVILNDVTAARAHMRDLRAARNTAELANAAKSDFLRNMNHELQTPLNVILGAAQVLERGYLPAAQHDVVGSIQRAGRHLSDLLADLLRIAAGESGAEPTYPVPTDISALVASAAAPFLAAADDKGLTLLVDAPPSLGWAQCDGDLLRRTLQRLLDNAIKFTDRGEIGVIVRRAGVDLHFTVSDTGVGIPPAQLDAMCEPFTQADTSPVRRQGGAGVGLAICRADLRRLGGQLDCISSPGVGSRFEFTLALPSLATPSAAPAPELATMGSRVLVVDDHAGNRHMLLLLLESAGVPCVLAENGREGVERAATEPFAAIFMDLQMPVLGGVEAIREIRGAEMRSGRARTPIFSISADGPGRSSEAAMAAGADAHLAKPLTSSQVFAVLMAHHGAEAARPPTDALPLSLAAC